MAPVPVEILPAPTTSEQEEIVVVEDLDALAESAKCSCNASDDNPY